LGPRTTAIVAAVIALLVGVAIGYAVKPSAPAPAATTAAPTPAAPAVTTIKIGALLPLSGDLATFGQNDAVVVKLAEEDVNKFFEKAGLPYKVAVVVEDTETKPDVALQKLQALHAQGIKLFVGPMSSAEVRNIKGYADANKLVIVSQSSTSPLLSIPGDYVFRLVVDDTFQGAALAGIIKTLGIEHVVIAWRGDAWGDGLANATKANLQKLGVKVYDGPRYAPEAKEFSAEVSQLAGLVDNLVKAYGASKVAVVIISFEEAVPFFIEASKYPVLSQVRWFGTDGITKSAALVADPVASSFAVKVQLWSTMAAPVVTPKTEYVKEYVVSKLGREPEEYAYNSYDAVWLLSLSAALSGKYDGEAVKNVLPLVADLYYGASGWTKLNDAGDRAFADFFVWAVKEVQGKPSWVLVGTYETATGILRPAA